MKPSAIVLHHSLTKDGETVSWGAIRRYHTSYKYGGRIITPEAATGMINRGISVSRPWDDIGYHFGIELVGDHYEALLGRMPDEMGAHCRDGRMNYTSIGICLIGDFDHEPPPKEQWNLALRVVRWLMTACGIKRDEVFGHREFAGNRSCPGWMFDLKRFREEL
jgi:N-acetylmuramoyl-L-alanine amidase